jgi:hypothetical protein
MSKYSNWTDDQINRAIGNLIGYVVEPADAAVSGMGYTHVIYKKEYEGEPGTWGLVGARSEDEAWSFVRYASDLQYAFSLAHDNPRYVSLETVTTWHSEYTVRSFHAQFASCEGSGDELLGRATTTVSLARAICEAWLVWKGSGNESK